jgi:hypothetical protein
MWSMSSWGNLPIVEVVMIAAIRSKWLHVIVYSTVCTRLYSQVLAVQSIGSDPQKGISNRTLDHRLSKFM